MKRVAVVGGGPKGAAIAAKAAAIAMADPARAPEIVLYEPQPIGAAWTGRFGYTDGEQPLCTLAERDLGFPYHRQPYLPHGDAISVHLFAHFSWAAFAVSGHAPVDYEDWVIRGRLPPRHRHFAEYLAHAVRTSGARVLRHTVQQLDYDAGRRQWVVDSTDRSSSPHRDHFDGVVLTGSGRPLPSLPVPYPTPRLFNGENFWSSLPRMRALLAADPDPEVVIIGAGGAAAAIAYWFVRQGITTLPVHIIGREATLYARHGGYFEDRLFTDDDAWQALEPHVRTAFVSRTTAGVVWDYVLRELKSDNIQYHSYDVRGLAAVSRIPSAAAPPELEAVLAHPAPRGSPPGAPATAMRATVFVDARGFDRWELLERLLGPTTPLGAYVAANHDPIEAAMDDSLAITGAPAGPPFPAGLHVPGCAAVQGPGANNLMALGWMSDRVLRPYL